MDLGSSAPSESYIFVVTQESELQICCFLQSSRCSPLKPPMPFMNNALRPTGIAVSGLGIVRAMSRVIERETKHDDFVFRITTRIPNCCDFLSSRSHRYSIRVRFREYLAHATITPCWIFWHLRDHRTL